MIMSEISALMDTAAKVNGVAEVPNLTDEQILHFVRLGYFVRKTEGGSFQIRVW